MSSLNRRNKFFAPRNSVRDRKRTDVFERLGDGANKNNRSNERRPAPPPRTRSRDRLSNSRSTRKEIDPKSIRPQTSKGSLDTNNRKRRISPRPAARRFNDNRGDNNYSKGRYQRPASLERPVLRRSLSNDRRRQRSSSIDRRRIETPSTYPDQFNYNNENYGKPLERQHSYTQPSISEWNRNTEFPNENFAAVNEPIEKVPLEINQYGIPEFNAEDGKYSSREWLNILEEIATKNNWSADDIKFHFALKLTGSAKTFLTQRGIMQRTWSKIKEVFVKAYPSDMEYYDQLVDMISINQKENENVLKYFHNKLAGITACGIIGRKAVSCLIGGLHDITLKRTALDRNFATTEDLYNFLSNTSKSTPAEENSRLHNHSTEDISINSATKPDKFLLTMQNKISRTSLSSHFMIDVFVNDSLLRGFASFDSDEVTITESAARNLNLDFIKLFNYRVRCFGDHSVFVRGGAQVFLRIQQATASLKIYIVSDLDQAIPIVIGKSFTTLPNVRYEFSENGVRFYSEDRIMDVGIKDRRSPGPSAAKYRRVDEFQEYKPRYLSPGKFYGKFFFVESSDTVNLYTFHFLNW